MAINLQNNIVHKNIVQKQKTQNKLININLKDYYVEKEYEIKSNYFNDVNKDITNLPDQWRESIFDKSDIRIMWDNKTNLFAFNFEFLDKNIDEIKFIFNNEKIKTVKPSFKYINSIYSQRIHSIELFDDLNDFKKIKTMQITLKNKEGSRVISIVFDHFSKYKQDHYIPKGNSLILNFQNSIQINGEKIKKTFSSIKFSPCEIKQGFWNKNFLKIEQQNNDLFDRNILQITALDNLPISSTLKSSFHANIDQVDELISFVKIDQNTYYNLDKKQTIVGFGQNSNPGYVVPFEFSGMFFPILNTKINNMDFLISWEENFDKPYFKNDEGLNKISLKYSYVYDKDNEWIPISLDLMNEAKKYNFTFEELKKWLINKQEKENIL